MFNATEILIRDFTQQLREGYQRTYGGMKHDYEDIIAWAGSMAMENIASSDALYHNVEHSIQVTLVGQEVLRGKHIREGGVSCDDWLHFIISLACHDIGYVKGVCRADNERERTFATGRGNETIHLPPGLSDASLTPYHVDRGKRFIDERFGGHGLINADAIKTNIELTRFPVPNRDDKADVQCYPGLVRSSDLIGQMSDPRYLQKINALYYEFEETGANERMGYKNPGDLRRNYARFYWSAVSPFIQSALAYLSVTQQGRQIVANLYANVFTIEHELNLEDHGDTKKWQAPSGDTSEQPPAAP